MRGYLGGIHTLLDWKKLLGGYRFESFIQRYIYTAKDIHASIQSQHESNWPYKLATASFLLSLRDAQKNRIPNEVLSFFSSLISFFFLSLFIQLKKINKGSMRRSFAMKREMGRSRVVTSRFSWKKCRVETRDRCRPMKAVLVGQPSFAFFFFSKIVFSTPCFLSFPISIATERRDVNR